jgi:hypothetical protein
VQKAHRRHQLGPHRSSATSFRTPLRVTKMPGYPAGIPRSIR